MSTVQTRNSLTDLELIKVSILCSALALNPWNFVELHSKNVFNDIETLNLKSLRLLVVYFSNLFSNLALHEVTTSLLQTYKMTFESNNSNLKDIDNRNERFKQYLRKFTFFFNYYYNNSYPNDLSKLSRKKINTLAVRSLFFLHSL